ncbi:zinc finger CCCH domain-containing protein 13 isoform X2 [Alosa sapidissima]|uniref:zinc finger CCCH domain-containing protein 13 isoform X2 n=1 Tax=Alosa sapidissima TaxID=34773 RepID=UPI001C08E16F|nr:zinc finger CCCH domain-containing protein 13 isoform X2 [Alosa sapidissima]
METRRTNLTHADTLRTAERGGHDVSPHATRRASERPRDPEPDARGWTRERELSFTTFKGRGGEAERDRRREQETPKRPNGRLLSMLESGPVVDLEGERAKGDTFPRMRKPSREPDRRANIIPEHERKRRDWEVERGTGTSQERQARTGRGGDRSRESDREMAQRRDKDIQRYREEERRRKRERGQLIEDWKQNVQRSLEREQVRAYDPSGQERRRERNPEGNDPRGPREMERERGRPRASDRANRSYSPRRQRATEEERGVDRPRGGNKDGKEYMREGRRDARSEGESDGGNRGNVRARVEYTATLQHKHSRSEGDNEGDERRERERQRDRERERERETGRNRDGYYERDRPRGRGRDTDRAVDKRRDEFSDTLRRGRDDRSGREREGGRPYPRDENVGRRREGERPAEREREQRRPRERAREGEDGGSPSPRSAQFRTQPSSDQLRAQSWASSSGELRVQSRASSSGELRVQSRASSSGEWMSGGSDLENERRRRGARDSNEGRETGQEGTPERERRRPREPVQGEHKRPESQDTTAQEGERRSVTGQDEREKKNEMDKMGADRDERAGERPEGRTMRRMWLVPGSERTRASRESSQEEELLVSMREAAAREPEAASQGLQDKYRMLERAEEFAGNRGRDGGGPEEGGGSESGSTDEREANVTEESDREREEGSEGLSDGEVLGVWRTSPSVEDGFVTVSSGGEEEEDNFEDCKEFWDGGVRDDATRQSQRGHERQRGGETGDVTRTTSDRDKAGTVFCVVGNKLPRKELHSRRAYLDLDNLESMPAVRTDYSKLKYNNRRSLDLTGDGTPKQEPTLSKDRDQDDGAESPNTQDAEKEPERQSLSNEHVQEEVTASSDDQINANSSPEPTAHPPVGTDEPGGLEDYGYAVIKDGRQEVGPTAEQPSGDGEIWATAQEMKRHSQAPHLKWAKSVVREILGYTDDPGLEGASEARTKRPADPNQASEGLPAPGPMPMPVYVTVQKRLEARDSDSEPQPPLEEENDDMRFSWNEVELRKVVDSIGRTTKKRNSKFFNSQLYQQYSEVVLNREILRQSDADTLPTHPASPCAPAAAAVQPSPAQRPLPPIPPLPHPLPSSGALSGGASTLTVPQLPPRPPSPRVSISSQTQSLWQELPSVRNSIELEEMSEDQRRLQEVRFEVVTSEASYSRSLDIVVEHFVKCKDLESFLTGQDRNWLFSRLVDVRAVSHSFLTKLEERVENNTLHFDVCDIITRHCQMFRMVYVPYLTNQSYQDKTYQRLMDENPSFKRCVEKLERSPVCQRLPLRSFLILPFQRITRLKLLVQNIVKRTAPKSDDEAQAIKAMKLLEKIIQDSNDSITQMKSIESLVSLSAKVDFECKTLPLISQSRRMVREGMVTELMDFSMKETERSVYIHLFNDYLLLSLPKEGGRFTVIDHAPVAELRAENCRVKLHSLKKNVFRLYLSRKMLLLRTGTLSDKLRWISAISSPHPEMDFTAAQDFPQMQCIRALVAQQPDELGLEKADVLLVHQESSDGWVEGTRMSDRHRGWAPKSHLESITNEKARQRNLMDIHKITTATAAL